MLKATVWTTSSSTSDHHLSAAIGHEHCECPQRKKCVNNAEVKALREYLSLLSYVHMCTISLLYVTRPSFFCKSPLSYLLPTSETNSLPVYAFLEGLSTTEPFSSFSRFRLLLHPPPPNLLVTEPPSGIRSPIPASEGAESVYRDPDLERCSLVIDRN